MAPSGKLSTGVGSGDLNFLMRRLILSLLNRREDVKNLSDVSVFHGQQLGQPAVVVAEAHRQHLAESVVDSRRRRQRSVV